MRALAKKADSLWSLHGMKSSFASAVASLVDVNEPSLVAVVSPRGSGCGRGRGRSSRGGQGSSPRGGGQQPGSQQGTGQSKAAASLLPREMARNQSGLCLYHFNHGEKAYSCTPLCNWGN